ncbi:MULTISPECIES: hypothetical protein [unclassified Janthinobacterium]|uniref:hypothetical protein n=1 Tax=unclassified Janthinobacterium TaxID=2610881 RepID=UPI001622F7FE|nr:MULTISPECIES: hypothetical protein [unclassified Janthinobacterium]MBB5369462.1 hypothetical protein [Janthinobacterium sp. K2C7]MBB5382582.1 hypothetical protein [Janthinobacterium sp. K2Li3]MBB5388159.1 hypothetical protein [Janthinobacterium sp. K2E3]
MKIFKAATLVAILFGGANFASAESVSVTSGPGPKLSNADEIAYSAECDNRKYEIRFQRVSKRLWFKADQQQVDVSDTALGHSINNRSLYGRLGVACLPNALNVQFFGFDTSKGTIAPVMFRAVIGAGGKVEGGEIQPTSQDAVIANKIN